MIRRRRRKSYGDSGTAESSGPIKRIEFGSFTEFAEYAAQAPKNDRSAAWREERDHSWDDGIGMAKAIKMAEKGWPEGARRAKQMLEHMQVPPAEDVHSVTVHDVTGSYVDVGEYVQGVPECMVNFQEDKRTARFANIVVAGCYSGGYGAEAIMERGICVAAVVDALESHGVRCGVELLVRQFHDWEYSVTLKRPEEPLNLDVLAFAVAHPATFRRLGFAVCEREPEAIRQRCGFYNHSTYGHVVPIPTPEGTITFREMHLDREWTKQNAKARIEKIVHEYCK